MVFYAPYKILAQPSAFFLNGAQHARHFISLIVNIAVAATPPAGRRARLAGVPRLAVVSAPPARQSRGRRLRRPARQRGGRVGQGDRRAGIRLVRAAGAGGAPRHRRELGTGAGGARRRPRHCLFDATPWLFRDHRAADRAAHRDHRDVPPAQEGGAETADRGRPRAPQPAPRAGHHVGRADPRQGAEEGPADRPAAGPGAAGGRRRMGAVLRPQRLQHDTCRPSWRRWPMRP